MASAFTRIDHVGIAVADLDVGGRDLRAPDRLLPGASPGGRLRRHRGGHVRGRGVAHRAARQHRAGVEDRGVPGQAGRRPPSRRLRRRRRSGQPRPLRRARPPAARHLSASRRRRHGWWRSSIPRRQAGCSPSCASPTRRTPGRTRERPPGRRTQHPAPRPSRAFRSNPSTWTSRMAPPPPGEYPYTRGIRADGLSVAAVDDAPVRGFRQRRADQPALPLPAARRVRAGCRWRSTCPPRWATTATTRWPTVRWARWAWPSTRSRTWSC